MSGSPYRQAKKSVFKNEKINGNNRGWSLVKSDISDIRYFKLTPFNLNGKILYFENLICLFEPMIYPGILLNY